MICRLLTIFLAVCAARAAAQPLCTVTYYGENDGLAQRHVTQVLQDHHGFMWFATWNGLSRFDGYEFRTFKSRVGDGCHMTTDRIRNMVLSPDNPNIIYCRVDERYFLFDLDTYQFRDLSEQEAQKAADEMGKNHHTVSLLNNQSGDYTDRYGTIWTLSNDGTLGYRSLQNEPSHPWPLAEPLGEIRFFYPDRQDNLWLLGTDGIYKMSFHRRRFTPFPQEQPAEVACLFADWEHRYWITTKDDATVRLYAGDDRLLGYLGRDGRLHPTYTSFGSPVYCIHQSAPGVFWLGTKPDGLFRMVEERRENGGKSEGSGVFKVEHFTGLPNQNIYDVKTFKDIATGQPQLWVATLGGGVCYAPLPVAADTPFKVPKGYPADVCQRVRELYESPHGELLMATTEGLLVYDRRRQRFHHHQKEPERQNSLSCSATMNICHDADGHIYVSTESGGVCRILTEDLTAEQLDFAHFDTSDGRTPTDIALSLNLLEGRLLVVSSNQLYTIDGDGSVTTCDARFFRSNLRFSDAHPLMLDDERWLVGTLEGAVTMTPAQRRYDDASPRIVLTHIRIQDGTEDWAIEDDSVLTLTPSQRSLSISFAALDYRDPENISYWFRLTSADDSSEKPLTQLGHNHTVTLPNLLPGTYLLEIHATNADGQPATTVRRLTLVVKPRFFETTLAHVLIVLLVLSIIGTALYTYLYIRRMNRKQRETLEAYLKLLDEQSPLAPHPASAVRQSSSSPAADGQPLPAASHHPAPLVSEEDDAFMQRVMAYVEQHLGDSDANVGDMADACAVSRSGLQRKMKHQLGITPQDFLREARLKRAAQLLRTTTLPVSEIAYRCGFSDPKYFSRTFKASTGHSPSELRTGQGE